LPANFILSLGSAWENERIREDHLRLSQKVWRLEQLWVDPCGVRKDQRSERESYQAFKSWASGQTAFFFSQETNKHLNGLFLFFVRCRHLQF
jgi:hypothetical protein